MHYNKRCNGLIKNEFNDQISLDYISSTINNDAKAKVSTALAFDADEKRQRSTVEQNEMLDREKCSNTTTKSCTSSTDSGVNISDNDEIPSLSPVATHLHSFETNGAVNRCSKQFQQYNKNKLKDNNFNNYKVNCCKIANNNNKDSVFNDDNDVNHNENDSYNSENFDNKFKVVDSSNGGQSTRNQAKSENMVESKNAINISQQRNLTTFTPTTSPRSVPATRVTNNEKPTLQQKEFIHLQQRHITRSSSLSISSIASSCDDNTHRYNGSPVVSIRSITSTIVTSDSDSELSSDIEGVHEDYVIKKLGTQVTFSPNDPEIPNINSGHTVLNQKVIPNSTDAALPALAALADIGDRIGAAHALGPLPSGSAVAQRPQIGSIALSNSSDVTFGDKYFYEGPVTIQQFLIDSSDKWKEANKNENATYVNENIEVSTKNAKDINSSAEKSSKFYEYILKRKKIIIPGVLALTVLLTVAVVLGSKTLNDSKNANNNATGYDDGCDVNSTLCLIERDIWHALPQKGNLDKQVLPLHRVVISHTASESCSSLIICADRVRVIQEFHMNSLRWDDIAYNFLISNDGRVYVGRGWDFVGAHTKGYNYDSVGIAFIGTYISIEPTVEQLNACRVLLEEGVRLKKLVPDYRLYGARQLQATESPGDMLYKIIKTWQHWSENINST